MGTTFSAGIVLTKGRFFLRTAKQIETGEMPTRLVSSRGGIELGRGLIRPHGPCGRDSLLPWYRTMNRDSEGAEGSLLESRESGEVNNEIG
jgi:hypothetical protein